MTDATDTPDSLEPESPESNQAPVIQDIDPATWLSASSGVITGFVDTKAGRLRIAALTEKEADTVRKLAESPDPRNPRQRQLNLMKLRLLTVASSVNKAYGYSIASPGYMVPEKMYGTLSGEITMIVAEITKLSGFTEDNQGQNPGDFLQVS